MPSRRDTVTHAPAHITEDLQIHYRGKPVVLRGFNIFGPRFCNRYYVEQSPDVLQQAFDAEIARTTSILDLFPNTTAVRYLVEDYRNDAAQFNQPRTASDVINNPVFAQRLRQSIEHLYALRGGDLLVEVSLWLSSTFDPDGLPTAESIAVWRELVRLLHDQPHVMFGVCNEPHYNASYHDGRTDAGTFDARARAAMFEVVDAIREEERRLGAPEHIIFVQGTSGWASNAWGLVDSPETHHGPVYGRNVAAEVHFYRPLERMPSVVDAPARQMPLLVGELGPSGGLDLQGATRALQRAKHPAPGDAPTHLFAWAMSQRCPPNAFSSGNGTYQQDDLSPWGLAIQSFLDLPPSSIETGAPATASTTDLAPPASSAAVSLGPRVGGPGGAAAAAQLALFVALAHGLARFLR
ncbi:MAG TPA: cellulase family glycosylhydrolase [Myxococcota bacterium]|nr:cellulase family glycosylhydrolase [Myxococcota bacterium]